MEIEEKQSWGQKQYTLGEFDLKPRETLETLAEELLMFADDFLTDMYNEGEYTQIAESE